MSSEDQELDGKKGIPALNSLLREAETKVRKGERYAHYKHPEAPYIVLGLVIIEATGEAGVVYQPEGQSAVSFVRPLGEFLGKVTLDSGEEQERFSKIQKLS